MAFQNLLSTQHTRIIDMKGPKFFVWLQLASQRASWLKVAFNVIYFEAIRFAWFNEFGEPCPGSECRFEAALRAEVAQLSLSLAQLSLDQLRFAQVSLA